MKKIFLIIIGIIIITFFVIVIATRYQVPNKIENIQYEKRIKMVVSVKYRRIFRSVIA